ncbi:urea ABC transporter permease subunit UrtB [Polycladidibacter stylochi]|uniref:urea ABC transporter permease subunit UrtB n=1 Tax=Polycladidibacter stylochi TaxID=1807766 RepID=UPI0009E8E4C3|nr:urea ABC transporter permease subunit UrtB [Pseudovibrio stylochi]
MITRLLQIAATTLWLLVALSYQTTIAAPANASTSELRQHINALATGKIKDKPRRIEALAQLGSNKAIAALNALIEGRLYSDKASTQVFMKHGDHFVDPLSLTAVNTTSKLKKVKANNKVRRIARAAIARLTLKSPNSEQRLQAVEVMFKAADHKLLPLIDEALEFEKEQEVKQKLLEIRAAITLQNKHASKEAQLEAIGQLRQMGSQQALGKLQAFINNSGASAAALKAADLAIKAIEKSQAIWGVFQNIWYGLSLGSVLLLAAIGLAITFGVMGIINMAHGEMVMLGAYTTFVVQEVIRTSFPGLFEYSLLIALPLAFLVAGAVGFAMERSIIRFLYGRPLETLLATWGVSLVLQQAIRSIFGPTNKEVGNPEWMSGAFELGGLMLTYNRLWILAFSLIVFAGILLVLNRSHFGLQMRAVTQNRRMAASMGIKTPWVDAFTFALGSGIAGIAGVALSQIANVSPNLGQSYIIDSFMVVVFGGVGNLWGTLVGAMSLGVANKFLEPYAGAVLAKILTLVVIILFIQKKPRGLFAQKGRAVEA